MEEMMNGQGGLSSMGMENDPAENEGPMEEIQEVQEGINIEDVIKALLAGIDPAELVQNGVPEELIAQAIQVIQEQSQAPVAAPEAPAPGGLSQLGM